MALGGGLPGTIKKFLPQNPANSKDLLKYGLIFMALIGIAVVSMALWFSGMSNSSSDPRAIARTDPVVANLLGALELHAKSDEYILNNFSTTKQSLLSELNKIEGKFTSDPAYSSHAKKTEILATISAMKTNLNTMESNLTSNKTLVKKQAKEFIANKEKLDQLINQRDQDFPVSFKGNPQYSDGWLDPRPGHKHAGTDIMAPRGTEVIAVADGTIERLAKGDAWGGFRLTIKPDSGTDKYYYAHIINIRVKNGQHVTKGQVIAGVGTANKVHHLHFGIKTSCSTSGNYNYAGSCWINPYAMLKQIDTRKK